MHLLDSSAPHHEGIGGRSRILRLNNLPIFVKAIPLTDIERLPLNWRSTSNLFNLPSFYHYGVGSAGFSAWRELAAHEMTTQWIKQQQSPCFPLLYHWRAMDSQAFPLDRKTLTQIESDVAYWDGSDAVRKRLGALHSSSAYVYLFLEYVPSNLFDWLQCKLQRQETSAIEFIETKLLETCRFMRSKNFIHFDAHFHNLLTDSEEVYFSDFGLCSSKEFNLEEDENAFHHHHLFYDEASFSVNLLHCIITSYFGGENWIAHLRSCLNGEHKLHTDVMKSIHKYAEMAVTMDEFYMNLQKVSKSTSYPIAVDSQITIRPAVLFDAEAIAKVHTQAWKESYQGIYDSDFLDSLSYEKRLPFRKQILENPSPQSLHLVAVHNEQVIGFLDAGPSHEHREGVLGEVYAIYLLEGYKGLGLGRRMMHLAAEFLQEQHLTPYAVWALENNIPARGLYEKLGGIEMFERLDERSGTSYKVVGYLIE